MEPKFISRIRQSLVVDETKERSAFRRNTENFFNKGAGKGGSISWGLILLGAFAVYAIIELCIVILKFF